MMVDPTEILQSGPLIETKVCITASYEGYCSTRCEAWERNVKDQAVRDKHSWVIEELLCGCECLRMPAFVLNQELQRLTHRDVVINNEYDGCCRRHG